MKNKLHYTDRARRDMDEIWDRIAGEYQNPAAATVVIDRIMDDIDTLGDFAEIGPLLSSIADVESDHRFLVSKKYLTFYRVCGRDVYIDRILNGRTDYLRILFEDMTGE